MRVHVRTFLVISILGLVSSGLSTRAATASARSEVYVHPSHEVRAGLQQSAADPGLRTLDRDLAAALRQNGFTGAIEGTLEARLGRPVNAQLADLGRLLWFDTITGLNDDNTCGGCHSPTAGFGDTQSIAIGIENNGIVGPDRTGPRNQRRAPIVINNVFYPNLMWNSRFASLSNDPFDNSAGFQFPEPEGRTLSYLPHLLTAQAFIPPTERNEVAGFTFPGDNFDIRAEVLRRLNATAEYRRLFGRLFPEVRGGAPINFDMFGKAISEFEFTLAFANTPLDRFARGETDAMSEGQKRGTLIFFGKAGCVGCHAVSGTSNEMFSDFKQHVIGIPQIVPAVTNSAFDGPGVNEDFGLEQITLDKKDRYKFRTSTLRNLAVQPTFAHNGAFTTIEAAVRHHLDVFESARKYQPSLLDEDLRGPLGPIEPVLKRVDPLLQEPIDLSGEEFTQLVEFLRFGLLDPRAKPENLMTLIPNRVPSGRPVLIFQPPEGTQAEAISLVRGATGMPNRGGDANSGQVLRVHSIGPNPVSGSMTLRMELSRTRRIGACVYDVAGRLVRVLAEGIELPAGWHTLRWDGTNTLGERAPNGLYFIAIRDGKNVAVARRVVVTR